MVAKEVLDHVEHAAVLRIVRVYVEGESDDDISVKLVSLCLSEED